MNTNPKIIGLCGAARSGKDSFYDFSKDELSKQGITSKRFAFADCLKGECDEFLWSHLRISAFTSNAEEKDLIRPLLVAWGTNIRRKLDKNCWIKQIEKSVLECINDENERIIPIVTDVRYPNEADWIHKLGGSIIHIAREGISPANKEEEENDPILKSKADSTICWGTLGSERRRYLNHINKALLDIQL